MFTIGWILSTRLEALIRAPELSHAPRNSRLRHLRENPREMCVGMALGVAHKILFGPSMSFECRFHSLETTKMYSEFQ